MTWTVVICRPIEKANQLVERLNQVKINSVALPQIKISLGRDILNLSNTLNSLPLNSPIFILSPNIFIYETLLDNFSVQKITQAWKNHFHYFAIGRSTAEKFKQLTDKYSFFPKNEEISETLIRLPELVKLFKQNSDLKHKSALLIRGNGGRQIIKEKLTQEGYQVTEIEAYKREKVTDDIESLRKIIHSPDHLVFVITSGEILAILMNKLNLLFIEDPKLANKVLYQGKMIVVSNRLEECAKRFGWSCVIVAAKANNEILYETVLRELHERD